MGVERVEIDTELQSLAEGDSAAQARLAEGLRSRPRIYRCSGRAAYLVPRGATAWTLGRYILVRADLWDEPRTARVRLLAHEIVHVAQWFERGRVRFMVAYVRPYLRERLRGARHWEAYRRVPAEDEAFDAEAALADLLEST